MRITLRDTPDFSRTYTVDFPKLAGGLNLRDLGYLVDSDESPNIKNLRWKNGLLQSRDGQVYVAQTAELDEGEPTVCYAAYESLFHGYAFFHIGSSLQCLDLSQELTGASADLPRAIRMVMPLPPKQSQVPGNAGTFFRYQDHLYYKNRGSFFQISYVDDDELDYPFVVKDVVSDLAEDPDNAPVIVINASPATGSGTIYQPENRISALKTVRYTAESGVAVYHLPTPSVSQIVRVKVGGVLLSPDQYLLDTTNNAVRFTTAPDPGNPIRNNTVEITYYAANPLAMSSIMNCCYATVSGGDTNLCIILGGCDAQPNAVFWNSNDELAMQPYYFPMTCYNLVGDTEDPVTGFGRQYNDTLVFKEHSVGKLAYSIADIDGRSTISFGYLSVNAKIGCDLPHSIQLVENNVVFANSYQGVHVVLSSSAAYENNIQCLSQKINDDGSASGTDINGLLRDIKESQTEVVSFDDDSCYWLCANGKVYAWDYSVSTYAKPSWFYWTNIHPVALFHDYRHNLYHLDAAGKITAFRDGVYADYGGPIDKIYQFPTQHFGSFDRLKDVQYILLSVRSDTPSTISVRYDTDYESRTDLTPVTTEAETGGTGQSRRYVHVAKRKPGCRHVRQFGLTLSNNRANEDLAIVSAQIFYRLSGKER